MAKIEQYAARGVWDPPTYSQAVKVTGAETILYIAGQVAYGENGTAVHTGDFKVDFAFPSKAEMTKPKTRTAEAAPKAGSTGSWQYPNRSSRTGDRLR